MMDGASPEGANRLEARGLVKRFGAKTAVDGVDLFGNILNLWSQIR